MAKKRIRLCCDNSEEEKNVYCVDVWQTEHIRTGGCGHCHGIQGYQAGPGVQVTAVFLDLD